MKFLYVAPRYHTNQIPIMKGLREHGDEVYFFSHYAGKIEDYEYVQPDVIGYSPVYRMLDYLYVKVLHKNDPEAGNKKLLLGFPPIFRLNWKMKKIKPDVVIIRERSVYSMAVYILCRCHHYDAILYNQSPVEDRDKTDFAHRVVCSLTPKVRMTPVRGVKKTAPAPNCFFVPFVMDLQTAPENRTYCENGEIHIFTVGKYEERKNLFMIVNVIRQLAGQYPVKLTIAGECSNQFQKDYYSRLKQYVKEAGLEDRVRLLCNLTRTEMNAEYQKTDLFVLPSTREPASISQLEAMAFSVPVVCSDTNGSACYVEEGHNGRLFQDNCEESLRETVETMLRSQDQLVQMGENAYQDVKEKYQFSNYYAGIMECLNCLKKIGKM